MKEIGQVLRETRKSSGVTLEEASTDLKIKELILENIEEGNIGCFKDIHALKQNIFDYAKYLGLNPEKTIDEFNEYMFEYTSKIPIKEMEKQVQEKKQEEQEKRVMSPYTSPGKEKKKIHLIIIYSVIAILLLVVIIWSVKQVTVNNKIANSISYVK